MKKVCALMIVGLMASAAVAGPWYARGSFNSWGSGVEMPAVTATEYSLEYNIGHMYNDSRVEFKVLADAEDWGAEQYPGGGNVEVALPLSAGVTLTMNFEEGAINDGWMPDNNRVSYAPLPTHGWDVMGSMNGWSDPFVMTDMGGGLFEYEGFFTAGDIEFKFRKTDDWNVAHGDHFGSNNIAYNLPVDGTYKFELDLANGRYRITPEPATLAMLAIGGLVVIRRR